MMGAALAEAGLGEIVAALCVVVGALFSLVAAIGLLRLPDLLMRMHAQTKAGTLGAGLILVGAAIGFEATAPAARAVGAIVFLLLTAPISAHAIGRAAYLAGVRLSDRTWIDERRGSRDDDAPRG